MRYLYLLDWNMVVILRNILFPYPDTASLFPQNRKFGPIGIIDFPIILPQDVSTALGPSEQDPEALLPADRLEQLQKAGYLLIDEAGMRASESGLLRLNALLGYLLT